jgi:hypothetical protein
MVRMRLSETDEIAVELYLVPPARFVAARDELVRQARAAGHRDLAGELRTLRRPTLSAWLVNMLARHQRERMQQLFGLGRELRQAQTRLDGEQLRSLPAQREDVIAELLGAARRHAAEAGVHPTDAALSEVEETLHAGLVDLAAGAAVMSGHLVRPMSHAGFGPLPQVDPAATPAPRPEPQPESSSWPVPGPGPSPRPGVQPQSSSRPGPGPEPWPNPVPAPVPDPRVGEERAGEWRMRPVEDELRRRREQSATAPTDGSNGAAVAPYGRPGMRAETPVDPAENVRRAEARLAEAASAHWQREHDLAEAEAAMEAVRDRQEWLEQQRMQIRRERVTAEEDLAAARTAQRAALRALNDARRALEAAEKRATPPGPD